MSERHTSLIVSDMDGTLLANDKSVPEGNRRAIKRAREKGIRFSICTGRIQTMTEFYLKELKLDTPVITANGAVIWDPVSKKILWDYPMDEDEIFRLMWFCKEHKLDYCALTMERSYFSPDNVRRRRFELYNEIAKAHGFYPMQLCEFDDEFRCLRGEHVYKVLIYEVKAGQTALARKYLDALEKTGYTTSEKGLLDIAHRSVNKGFGLARLAELLHIPLERVCAMGDYENDIPMLEICGSPVAMGNGLRAVREKAVYVSKSNEEAGVAWAMEHFLNI